MDIGPSIQENTRLVSGTVWAILYIDLSELWLAILLVIVAEKLLVGGNLKTTHLMRECPILPWRRQQNWGDRRGCRVRHVSC